VRVTYPRSAALTGLPWAEISATQIETGDSQAVFFARDLHPDSGLRVRLSFQPGSLIDAPPLWQARAVTIERSAPAFVILSLLIFAAGAVWLTAYWLRQRRPFSVAAGSALRATQPPDDLPPAIAGLLIAGGVTTQWQHALGTLFDLARRGIVRIEESAEHKWYRRNDFTLYLESQPVDLRAHEHGLLDLLFTTKAGPVASVKLSHVSNNLVSQLKKFTEPLHQEMQAARMFSPERQAVRKRLSIFGIVILLASGVGLVAALTLTGVWGGWPLLMPFALAGIALVGLVMAVSFSPLSDEGAQQAGQWKGFAAYLRDVTRGRESPFQPKIFEMYLPYAASFGLAQAWATFFKKQGLAEIPAWFQAAADSSGIDSFVAMAVVTSSAGSAGAAGSSGSGGSSGAG
jgi:uncharacterized membrane protein